MRLYLSSERLGERAGALLALLGGRTHVAVINNALDYCSPMARQIYRDEVYDPVVEMAALGLQADLMDLRHYFGEPERMTAAIARYDLVWVTHGNSFVLRRAMRESGFDAAIVERVKADAIVYGGCGAGAMVAGPNLRGMELMDDPWETPEGYDSAIVWSGLGLTDFAIVPHYRSRHPETGAAEQAAQHLKARKSRFRALRDGEVIVSVGEAPFERIAS